MKLLIGWALNALVLLALPYVLSGVTVTGFGSALLAALVLGLVNTLVRPVVLLLTLPINLVTLGLFTLLVNGAMFWLASRFLDGFSVAGFWWAVLAALVYSSATRVVDGLISRD